MNTFNTAQVIWHLHGMADRLEQLLRERAADASHLPYVTMAFRTPAGEALILRVAVEVAPAADPPSTLH